jgi:hypothetical protein
MRIFKHSKRYKGAVKYIYCQLCGTGAVKGAKSNLIGGPVLYYHEDRSFCVKWRASERIRWDLESVYAATNGQFVSIARRNGDISEWLFQDSNEQAPNGAVDSGVTAGA